MLQLIAFLSGGFAMGATVGLVVIFAFRPGLLGSAHFTLPKVQIVIGVLALLMAALLAAGVGDAATAQVVYAFGGARAPTNPGSLARPDPSNRNPH